MSDNEYHLWTAKDLAKHYNVSVTTIYKRRMYEPDQIPPALKLGHRVSWIPSRVAEWDNKHVVEEGGN